MCSVEFGVDVTFQIIWVSFIYLIYRLKGGEKHTGGGRESGSDAWKAYMRRSTW